MSALPALYFVLVGALWGCTNPILKKGSETTVKVENGNIFVKNILQLFYIVKNYKFMIPFAFNQFGSALYVFLLGKNDISMAVPICNSLTFVFTALTSRIMGEIPPNPLRTYTGCFLVLLGVTICVYSKISVE